MSDKYKLSKIYRSLQHGDTLVKELHTQFKEGRNCDLEIRLNRKRLYVHKCLIDTFFIKVSFWTSCIHFWHWLLFEQVEYCADTGYLRCSVSTIITFYFVITGSARWYDGENAMVRWWNNNGTMVKSQCRNGTMVKMRCYIMFSSSYHRCFTIIPSRFHHRNIAFSPLYHRCFIIVQSYYCVFIIVLLCIAGNNEIKSYNCPTEHRSY